MLPVGVATDGPGQHRWRYTFQRKMATIIHGEIHVVSLFLINWFDHSSIYTALPTQVCPLQLQNLSPWNTESMFKIRKVHGQQRYMAQGKPALKRSRQLILGGAIKIRRTKWHNKERSQLLPLRISNNNNNNKKDLYTAFLLILKSWIENMGWDWRNAQKSTNVNVNSWIND